MQQHIKENIIKKETRKMVDNLSDKATWDDLMHEIYVRQTIEAGVADSKAGRVTEVSKVREKFGLAT